MNDAPTSVDDTTGRGVAFGFGDLDWARTSNLQLRRLTLYPIELRDQEPCAYYNEYDGSLQPRSWSRSEEEYFLLESSIFPTFYRSMRH